MENKKESFDNMTDNEKITATFILPKEIFKELLYESENTGIDKDALMCMALCQFLILQESAR